MLVRDGMNRSGIEGGGGGGGRGGLPGDGGNFRESWCDDFRISSHRR